MTTNESFHLFLRLIKEKHQRLIATSDALIRALTGEDANNKKAAATVALETASDLRALLSSTDVPGWLQNTIHIYTAFIGGQLSAFDLLNNFILIKASLETHSWTFEKSAEAAFDFDSIFSHFKSESRLPELFEQIIKILEDIESSGEIDSVTMLKSLGKVIATIKRSKDGSYFSLNSAWEFLLSFLKHYMWGEISKVPLLGPALEALEKTIKETNEEMFKLHQQVQKEMSQTVEAEVKVLKNKPVFQFIAYDKSGHLLASPVAGQPSDVLAFTA